MHHLLRFILLTLYSGALVAEPAPSLPVLSWAKNHAPPFYIADAGGKNGFADGVQAFLERALPQYQHRSVEIPLPRLNDFWRKGEHYCFASMIHKPLPDGGHYVLSAPNVYYLPHGIIVRRDFPIVDGSSQYPLTHLLNQPQLRLGTVGSRSFGPTVDKLIAAHADSADRFVRRDHDGLQGLLQMLLLERIDYVIDYAFVFEYYQSRPQFNQGLRFIRLTETRDEGVLGAIGCTNNEWGRGVIDDINSAITQLVQAPDYRRFVADWQGIDMSQQQYWQAFSELVLVPKTERDRP